MIVLVRERHTHTHTHTETACYGKNPIIAVLLGSDYRDGVSLQMAEGWTAE